MYRTFAALLAALLSYALTDTAFAQPQWVLAAPATVDTTAIGIGSSHVPATVTSFQTNGYRSVGDGGGADYARATDGANIACDLVDAGGARFHNISPIINFEMCGAYGDATAGSPHDDLTAILNTFALANSRAAPIEGAAKCYYVLGSIDLRSYASVSFRGANPGTFHDDLRPYPQRGTTCFVEGTGNVPIVRLAYQPVFSGAYLRYATQQTAAQANAIGLELNRLTRARIEDVTVANAAIGIGIPQTGYSGITSNSGTLLATPSNVIYAAQFDHIEVDNASVTYFDFRCYNGGCTNIHINEWYANGGGALGWVSRGQPASYIWRIANASGLEMDAGSVDVVDVDQTMIEVTNSSVIADAIRWEEAQVTMGGNAWVTVSGQNTSFESRLFELYSMRSSTATGQYLFAVNQTSPPAQPRVILRVNEINIQDNGLSYSSFSAPSFKLLSMGCCFGDDSDVSIGTVTDAVGMGVNIPGHINSKWDAGTTPTGTVQQKTPVRVFAGRRVSELSRLGGVQGTQGYCYNRYVDIGAEGQSGSGATNYYPPTVFDGISKWNTCDRISAVGNVLNGQITSWRNTGGGVDGFATGTVTFSAAPANGETLTLNGATITFVNGTPSGAQVQIAATADLTARALAAYINANYATLGVSAPANQPAQVNLRYNSSGTSGNAFTLAKSSSAISLSGATLSSGASGFPGNWYAESRAGYSVPSGIGLSPTDSDADIAWTATYASDHIQLVFPITAARALQLGQPRGDVGPVIIERTAASTGAFCRNVQTNISGTWTTIACLRADQTVTVRYQISIGQWVVLPTGGRSKAAACTTDASGNCTITWSPAFGETPVVQCSAVAANDNCAVTSNSSSAVTVNVTNLSGTAQQSVNAQVTAIQPQH